MKKTILAAALAAAAAPALAANTAPLPDADPALWVVKDEDTTVYLFGTFHMLDGKSDWFNDEIREAFDQSQELVLEAILPEDPASIQPLIVKYAVDPQGRKLSERLTPAVKAKVDAHLAGLGVPAAALEPMEPWFVSTALSTLTMQQKLGISGEHGPEGVLTKAAKAAGKQVGELEGVEFQLRMLDAMPEDDQVEYLGQVVDDLADITDEIGPLLTAWSSGDAERLVAIQNEGLQKHPELYKVIYSDRNARWAEWIADRLERPGTVFMAVGTGHLAGKLSVQDHLASRGIAAGRVEE